MNESRGGAVYLRRLLRRRVLLAEALDTAGNVHDLVFARVERMARGANVGRETTACRSGNDDRATCTVDRRHDVVGMDVLLHDGFLGSERRAGASSTRPFEIARKNLSPSALCPPRMSLGTIFSRSMQKQFISALTPERLWLVSCPKLSREAGSSRRSE